MISLTCPACGAVSHLVLRLSDEDHGTQPVVSPSKPPSGPGPSYRFTIGGRQFELTASDIRIAVGDVHQPIYDSFVEIEDEGGVLRQVPTKDLIRQAILRRNADVDPKTLLQPHTGFQSQRAEQIARRLGFEPKRRLRRA